MAESKSKDPNAPLEGAAGGVGGATPTSDTSSPSEAGERVSQEVIRYLLQRFPQMLYDVEEDEEWMIIKINLGDIILSSTDLEWLLKTNAFELDLFTEDNEIVCYLYFEKEEEE
jgi:hypothetical protein